MKLFLTSSVHAVAHHFAKKLDLKTQNALVFITTPAEPETGNKQWLANDRQALVEAGFKVSDYTITGKNRSQLESDLEEFEYVYMSGGDTLYLSKISKETGFDQVIGELVLHKGKTYIGTSAGSIIAGQKCPDYLLAEKDTLEIENYNGYGFVNFTVVPHWGSEDFRDLYLGGRLKIAYKADQIPLLVLTDHQYVIVEDDMMRIVEVK